jgi:hypothetical protein
MIKLKNILEGSGEIKKGGWIQLSGKALDKFKDEISDLISIASKNSKSISPTDTDGYKYMAVNLDKDPGPDAVRIYKEKDSGKVIIGVGHDGSNPAKEQLYTMDSIRKGMDSGDEGTISSLIKLWNKM